MKKIFFLALFFVSATISLFAQPPGQDKQRLEKERQDLQKELKDIQNQYNKVKGQKNQTLGQLTVLSRKINLQEQYIGSINKELRSIDDDIYLSNLEIYRLNRQMDTLKIQYARTVVYAYKNRSNYDYLNFIFSASSFNDIIRRISYLKSYRSYREKQMKTILETEDLIAKRQDQQLVRKEQKNSALTNQTEQVEELAEQKKEKDVVITELKSKEKDLQSQLAAKKKKDREVQNAITTIVRREIEAAKKIAEAKAKAEAKERADAKSRADAEAKRKADEKRADEIAANKNKSDNKTVAVAEKPAEKPVAPEPTKDEVNRNVISKKPDSYVYLNASDVALNNKFELNRGRLPWPVDNGITTLRFGKNKIENTLLDFDNPGITIATPSAGAPVRAVFEGEVVLVYDMGDGSKLVTIKHGKYFTSYSNLTGVSVSKDSKVTTGQVIGKTGKADEGDGGQIDLILMNETRNVDPYPWMRR